MDGAIYANDNVNSVNPKYSTNGTGPRSSKRSSYLGVTVFLGLLSVFLLAGLIVLGVHCHNSVHDSAAELSALKHNMTELLQTSKCLSKQKKTCPAGWKMFSCSCYFLSEKSGSWDEGRQDCRNRGADLVVIDSPEEQIFVSNITNNYVWIGLNDKEVEGTWEWVDGTPLTLNYWWTNQPDNGGGISKLGKEDCGHIKTDDSTSWNDLSCATSLLWICEKIP